VSVEAEVGTIGTTAEYGAEIENPHLADPAACEAMGETGIDALAVAIGNAHGVNIAEPKLDFDLLAEIRRRTEVPLVLHGGSGIPVDQGGAVEHDARVALADALHNLLEARLWSRWRPATTSRPRTTEEINATMFWFPALADSTGCTP